MSNGDSAALNPEMGETRPLTVRDLEHQVIQEVLALMTNTSLLDEVEAADNQTADAAVSQDTTPEDWKKREQQLLEKIAALESQIPIKEAKTNPIVVTDLAKKLYNENHELRAVLAKMMVLLKEKTGMCVTQETKITAMAAQVNSLKEVVAITKDLLNIRNVEVNHLSQDIQSMQTKIDEERTRHNQLMVKMEKMMSLNGALKDEYKTQLKIFQELREKYEAKMKLVDAQAKPPVE